MGGGGGGVGKHSNPPLAFIFRPPLQSSLYQSFIIIYSYSARDKGRCW